MTSDVLQYGLSLTGLLSWLAILLLPGLFLTFALPLHHLPGWSKVSIGVALSPLVVAIEFYALRLLGVPFESTAGLIAAINLPAILLVYAKRNQFAKPKLGVLLLGALVFSFAVVPLAPQLLDSKVRIFTGHSWMQSDIVYMLADGKLVFEEPELAGVRLGYPPVAHSFQALLSFSIDDPPASSYIWTNLAYLLLIFALVALIVRELGGGLFSQLASFIVLCFGLNFVGYVLFVMVPGAVSSGFWLHGPYNYAWIGGDYRFTPWLLKYFFFEHSIIGQTILAAIILLLILKRVGRWTFDELVLLNALLIAVGLLYPAHFPAAVIAVMAAVGAGIRQTGFDRRHVFAMGLSIIFTSAITLAYLKLLTVDRVTASMLFPSITGRFAKYSLIKAAGCVVSMALFLAAVGTSFPKFVRERGYSSIILVVGGVCCMGMYVFLEIPSPSAEYKFLLLAVVFMTPLAAISLESLIKRSRWPVPLVVLIGMALVLPAYHKAYTDFPWIPPWRLPSVDASGFELRLLDEEPLSSMVSALRERTPADSILVIEKSDIHLPTVAHRQLYAPPLQEKPHPGVFIMSNFLLAVQKGYGRQIVDDRRTTVKALFNSDDEFSINQAHDEISQVGRPIAIALDPIQNRSLRNWIVNDRGASMVFSDEIRELWLIGPSN